MAPVRLPLLVRSLCAICLLLVAVDGSAAAPSAEAFATMPIISDVALSPNGTRLAWADRSGAEIQAIVFDLPTAQIKHRIAVGKEYKLHDLNWSDDETLLIDLSQTDTDKTEGGRSYEVYRTLAVSMATGKGHILLMTTGNRNLVLGASLLAWRTEKPKHVIMSTMDWADAEARTEMGTRLAGHRADSGWVSFLFDVDTDTGKGVRVVQGSQFTVDWIVDNQGHCLARSEWNPKLSQYRVLAKAGAGWREIYARNDRGDLELHGPTADGTGIIAIGPNAAGRRVALVLPLDGSAMKVLYEDPAVDVEAVEFDRFDGTPVGVSLGGQDQAFHWFDEKAKKRFEGLQRAFKGLRIHDYGRSEDGKRVLARVEGPSNAPIYYLVDYANHKADIVGDEYPGLANAALGEVRAISYKARDGTQIPAFLTLPPGSSGKNVPLVVMPHGGPHANDDVGFDWWSQFLATRGYAVLRPQFRGSTGYGDAFQKAGDRQWGLLMQDDVTDGVKAMIDQGIADAKRVCIAGWSYGGYAALAGAAFTPELYKCAVSVAGVSDLPDILGWEKAQWGTESWSSASAAEQIGSRLDKAVIERSPARAAANVRAPVLLLHGQDDTVVPVTQSEKMSRELTSHGRQVLFVQFPGQDHSLQSTQARLRVLQEMEKFLAANL